MNSLPESLVLHGAESPLPPVSLSLLILILRSVRLSEEPGGQVRQSRHLGLKNLRRPWLSRSVSVGLAPERGRASFNLYVLSAWLPHPGLAILAAVHSCTSEGKQSQHLGIQTKVLMDMNRVRVHSKLNRPWWNPPHTRAHFHVAARCPPLTGMDLHSCSTLPFVVS